MIEKLKELFNRYFDYDIIAFAKFVAWDMWRV